MSKADLESKLNNNFKALRIKNNRRAHDFGSSLRNTFVGKLVEKKIFGNNLSDEQHQIAQDIASINNIRKITGDIEEAPEVYNSTVQKAIKNMKVSSLLYQYYSANSHDAAQSRILFDAPIWSVGYRLAGPVGFGITAITSLNRAMSSEHNFYQLKKLNTELTQDYLKMFTGFSQYAMNRNKVWLEWEGRRGGASLDSYLGTNRIESHNIVYNFHEIYSKAVNARIKYEPKFVEEMNRYRGEQKRLTSDIAFGMGFAG